jgi:hypothetical protein
MVQPSHRDAMVVGRLAFEDLLLHSDALVPELLDLSLLLVAECLEFLEPRVSGQGILDALVLDPYALLENCVVPKERLDKLLLDLQVLLAVVVYNSIN